MWLLIFPVEDPSPGTTPTQVTDGLPRVGFRTLLWAILLALLLALGMHMGLKALTVQYAFHAEDLDRLQELVRPDTSDWSLATTILDSPLYSEIPLLDQTTVSKPDYKQPASAVTDARVDFVPFLPSPLATYFATEVSAVQIYRYFVSDCETDAACQESLLKASNKIVSGLKHNALYILYRLEGGYIQLFATYIFSIGLLVLLLREMRANEIRHHLKTTEEGRKYATARGWMPGGAHDTLSLSLRDGLSTFWSTESKAMANANSPDIDGQIDDFGMVLYEPIWSSAASAHKLLQSRGDTLRWFHQRLARVVKWNESAPMNAATRFRTVLPRTIYKVTSAFAVDQAQFPHVARERAGEALDHSVDELAASVAADRDLYSRLVELTPVVGFFGTVWGLSLAMLGANDVIRAQDGSWNYNVADGLTFITQALLDPSERQQFALQGMLGALSIKFDTTGYALILMFILILLGAHAARREYRAISFLHSVVSDTLLSVLPNYGGLPTTPPPPNVPVPQNPPPSSPIAPAPQNPPQPPPNMSAPPDPPVAGGVSSKALRRSERRE